jgi:hypothetical protein
MKKLSMCIFLTLLALTYTLPAAATVCSSDATCQTQCDKVCTSTGCEKAGLCKDGRCTTGYCNPK